MNATMGLLSSINDYFSLDVGTTAIRAVQLRGGSMPRSLARYGAIPIEEKVSHAETTAAQTQLADAVRQLTKDTGISSRNVVVGIPTNKVFTTVVDIDNISAKELEKTIKYQADQFIPTAVSESKIDWVPIGPSPVAEQKQEVIITSVSKKYAEARLDLLESAGFNVIAMEPDTFGLCRALIKPENKEATMILDVGANTTDLVISYNDAPRLIRSISMGGNGLLRAAQQNLAIDEKQAMQFVYKFGLMQNKLEGQVFKAIQPTVDQLVAEIEKSIKFFATRYKDVPLKKIIVTGRASILPDFPVYLVNKTNTAVEIGNSWQNVSYPQNSHNDLMAISNQYSVAVGLAERKV